jgi:hypothetical protein
LDDLPHPVRAAAPHRSGHGSGLEDLKIVQTVQAFKSLFPLENCFFHSVIQIETEFLATFRAYSMTEPGFRVFGDILLKLMPACPVVTNFLAVHADGNDPFKPLDLRLSFQYFAGSLVNLLFEAGVQFFKCRMQAHEFGEQRVSHGHDDEEKCIFADINKRIELQGYEGIIDHSGKIDELAYKNERHDLVPGFPVIPDEKAK